MGAKDKYMSIEAAVSTKNRCSAYGHLISKNTFYILFYLNCLKQLKYYLTSVKE